MDKSLLIGLFVIISCCCFGPFLFVILITKLINYFSPTVKSLKRASYFDFITFRGICILVFSVTMIVLGYAYEYFAFFLSLGVFLVLLIGINLLACLFLKVSLEFQKNNIELLFTSSSYYADQPLKISRIFIPIISKLIYIFPTKIFINIPDRLGGSMEFEINSQFLANPELLLPYSRRGQYAIGPMVITFNDFFGAVQTSVFFNHSQLITIFPYYENVQNVTHKFYERSFKEVRQSKALINDENYFDVREYTPQDDTRRINWKLSARTDDRLLVKKPENININIKQNVTIFIDNSNTGLSTESFAASTTKGNILYKYIGKPLPNSYVLNDVLDKQISIAASLANFYMKHGAKVKIAYIDGGALKIFSPRAVIDMLEQLSKIEFAGSAPNTKGQVAGGRAQVLEKRRTVQLITGSMPVPANLDMLKKESIVYIYNTLTNPYYFKLFREEYESMAASFCVDAKSFLIDEFRPKSSRLKKLILTEEYFAEKKRKHNRFVNDQIKNYIKSKSINVSGDSRIATASDSLSAILNA
jgi:hypothetical protein